MDTIVRKTELATVVLALVLSVGCNTSKQPPSKSAFFTSWSDLHGLVARTASDAACAIEKKEPFSSSGNEGRRLHHVSGLVCDIRGNPEAADKLLQSLKPEVEKLAKQNAAGIFSTTEGKSVDGHLGGFAINYGVGNGNTRGSFKADLQPKRDGKDAQLRVEIEEWAG